MKLIDKDALVAEIEKLVDKGKYHEEYDCAYRDGNNGALYALKGKLDTLEVKEVDLEKEYKDFVDVESAMQEVEEKSKAFTEAHKEESADEILAQMRCEESVSEDLGEYIDKLSKQFPEVSFAKLSRIAVRVAKWQKEQFEKERLKHCDELTDEQAQIESDFVTQHLKENSRTPTFIDAIEYGMRLQKEKMMAKAGNGRVNSVSNRQTRAHITVAFDSPKDIEVLDRLKVIVINEE